MTSRRRPLRAIVLAGGASSRLGVDKPEQQVGGRRLLDVALAAVADADAVVVVGPPRDVPGGVAVVCEDPVGSGPVAALAAGFAALPGGAADVAVLAADLPGITSAAVAALAAARGDAPAALALDDSGRVQYLAAVWDSAALAAALAAAPPRVRDLLPGNAVTSVVGDVADVDTPEQLAAARARADTPPTVPGPRPAAGRPGPTHRGGSAMKRRFCISCGCAIADDHTVSHEAPTSHINAARACAEAH